MQRISITNPQNIIDGTAKKYYFKLRNTGGPKGDKGDKGDTGATGPQGPQGNAATVSVGSTTTLQVGQDATVENVGSIYNAVLNFGIPQGPQGPQGATGAKGDKGDKGDQGNPGPQGEKGTNATVYVGTTSTLNPGSQATVYNSGTDSNAVLNFGIPKGEKGDTGPMPTIAQTTGQAIDQVMSQKATTDALNTKQDALTAGTGIDITSGVISTPAIVPEVVTELPTTGAEGKLYLTPKAPIAQTASGNPITVSLDEDEGAIDSFQLDGDTLQDGEPSPENPVAIQTVTGQQTVSINATNYPISLGSLELCKLGSYQDYIWKDGENWKVHKATAIASASNRAWTWSNVSPNGWYFSRTNYGLYDANKINVISKSFMGVKRSDAPNTSGAFITMSGDGNIGIRNPNITGSSNLTQFTNWLNSLNTTWLYALTTPTDTTITDQTFIAQLEAVLQAKLQASNTITNTATGTNLAGDMEIGYYGFNPTNRYDKFIWLDLNNNYEQIGGE